MVHLDAEEEHSARGCQNGWAYVRGHVTTPPEVANFVAQLSSLGVLCPENLHRLIELLNLQWLLQNRDRTDLNNPIEDLAIRVTL